MENANLQYTWKTEGSLPDVKQGKKVVLEMMEGLQRNTVTFDNFFTSYALAEELLRWKVALVGTIQRNKPAAVMVESAPILPVHAHQDALSGVIHTQMGQERAAPQH